MASFKSLRGRRKAQLLIGILGTDFFGYLCLVIFALADSNRQYWKEILATTFLIQAAAALVGIILGFLFGIPKALQETPNSAIEIDKSLGLKPKYRSNTNLEQVSDWLTKILVGVGLTQFMNVKIFLNDISEALIAGAPGLQNAKSLIVASIIFKLLLGFLGSYLMTRLFMGPAFAQADEEKKESDATIRNLINMNLNLANLTHKEKEFLKNIIKAIESKEPFILPENFDQNSEQYNTLQLLEKRYILKPEKENSFKAGKPVELTPIAVGILDRIKEKITE